MRLFRLRMLCDTGNLLFRFRQENVVISFPRVEIGFNMASPYFRRSCFYCDAPAQTMSLTYKQLPASLVAHFVDGLSEPHLRIRDLDFSVAACSYAATCIVQHVTQPSDHFIAWVRRVENGKLAMRMLVSS